MIRHATPTDAPAIAAIHVRAWQVAYEGVFPDEFLVGLSVQQRTEFWHQELTENRSSVLVFEKDGVIAGWASGGASRDADVQGTSEIYAVYVAPDHWRHGIGRRLMTAIEERLSSRGDVTLWVLVQNQRAIAFYRTCGYQSDGGEKSGQLGGVTISEVRFRKQQQPIRIRVVQTRCE
jgi:ribosomal protein S18 acetylase RimI-like enzyme